MSEINNKKLILTHKEFAEIIIERLQNKIKECEEKLNKAKTDTRKVAITGKMMGLNEAIEERMELPQHLQRWKGDIVSQRLLSLNIELEN